MCEMSFSVPFTTDKICFNALVSFLLLVFLWGINIFCMADPTGASTEHLAWVMVPNYHPQYFTCFYILGNPVMFAFIVWVGVAYHCGHIKSGHKNAQPEEFSDISYFLCSSVWVSGLVCSFIVSVNPSGTRA